MQGRVSAADMGDAVMIEGSGVLTTCRSWIFFTSCTTHKVRLPERVAAGDRVNLSYGSNPKNYTFEIALIRLEGDACTLMSESSRSNGEGEKIEVARCGPFPDGRAQARWQGGAPTNYSRCSAVTDLSDHTHDETEEGG
jgi:hypothetical protein